jgi:hypothetical protein
MMLVSWCFHTVDDTFLRRLLKSFLLLQFEVAWMAFVQCLMKEICALMWEVKYS